MNTTTDKMPCEALEAARHEIDAKQDKKDWAGYSQLIAAAMSKRMVELGLTQQMLAEKMNCTQQYISKMLKGKDAKIFESAVTKKLGQCVALIAILHRN